MCGAHGLFMFIKNVVDFGFYCCYKSFLFVFMFVVCTKALTALSFFLRSFDFDMINNHDVMKS